MGKAAHHFARSNFTDEEDKFIYAFESFMRAYRAGTIRFLNRSFIRATGLIEDEIKELRTEAVRAFSTHLYNLNAIPLTDKQIRQKGDLEAGIRRHQHGIWLGFH